MTTTHYIAIAMLIAWIGLIFAAPKKIKGLLAAVGAAVFTCTLALLTLMRIAS